MTWDPEQYQRFGDERSRPFFELVDRVPTETPRQVVDLGCGPGPLTAALGRRWPQAAVIGVDNDIAMIAAADAHARDRARDRDHARNRVRFELADIATWTPSTGVDVIVANAAFQWVPGHRDRLAGWMGMLNPGGALAFQVPGNLDDPHHIIIRSLRASSGWRSVGRLADLLERTHDSFRATEYLTTLAPIAATVDAWETTYVHILSGVDPVLEWVKGTALRPVLAALDNDGQRADFCADLAPLLRDAYPAQPWGTPFPFRRVFVVATR